MIWVWTVSLPVTILNSPNVLKYRQHRFGTGRDIAGVIIFAIGLAMESVSDMQKYYFRRDQPKSAVCDKGLFAWSRHPNYFGEIIIQFGESLISSYHRAVVADKDNSNIYDCSLSSSRWLRSWPSLSGSLRDHRWAILPHCPSYVPFRPTSL